MKTKTPPLPSDTLLELTSNLIDEGRFVGDLNAAIAEANEILEKRIKKGDTKCRCKITATIEIASDKDLTDHRMIRYAVTTKTPKEERSTLAKSKNGRLLCQADGTGAESPDELKLFDRQGRAIGLLDVTTGETKPLASSDPIPMQKKA